MLLHKAQWPELWTNPFSSHDEKVVNLTHAPKQGFYSPCHLSTGIYSQQKNFSFYQPSLRSLNKIGLVSTDIIKNRERRKMILLLRYIRQTGHRKNPENLPQGGKHQPGANLSPLILYHIMINFVKFI